MKIRIIVVLVQRVNDSGTARNWAGSTTGIRNPPDAGRYWIAPHGLATLVNAGRMQVLHGSLDQVLEHLIDAVAPTRP